MKSLMIVTSLAAVASIVACDRGPTVAGVPVLGASGPAGSLPKTYDDELAELADRVPGFGGVFFDSTGQLVVQLKDANRMREARAGLKDFFAAQTAGAAVLAAERARQVDEGNQRYI